MSRSSDMMHRNLHRVLGLVLLIVTIGVFWQVQHHDFIYFDDPAYVTDNRHVRAGLTKDGFAWAFSTFHVSNWHPLTWLSHMLDCQLYCLNPAGHHLTNLFFHVANILLLFLVLREATGRLWESAVVAALFAFHPLHVESVAWVSERKDVLSTFFWMLTLLAYVRYVRNRKTYLYLFTLMLFVLGLLAKPMLVTLPFVLLLLDYWPLQRLFFGNRLGKADGAKSSGCETPVPFLRLVWEKIPFFVLAGASCLVTLVAQSKAMQTLDAIPLQSRIVNALVSYVRYMGKMVWPQDLAVFYPHPGNTPGLWAGLVCALLLATLCVVTLLQARQRPYLCVGWFWFLGTLVPVIGLVQVGMQAMADRYTYIPLMGLFVAAVWGLSDMFEGRKVHRSLLALFWGVILFALMGGTWLKLQHWQNTLTLFQHALTTTKDNYAAHFILARAEGGLGAMDKAFFHYNKAVELNPAYVAMMHNRVGYRLAEQGDLDEAINQFSGALEIRPDYANAHNNWGVVLARKGRLDEAIAQFSEALKIQPDYARAQENLKNARRERETMHVRESGGS